MCKKCLSRTNRSQDSRTAYKRRRLGFGRFACISILLLLLILPMCPAASQATSQYKIGSEDVISIVVTRHAEFSGDFYVPQDGVINIASVGALSVAGKTLDEISALVRDRLTDRLQAPEVAASLKTARMQRIYVLGSADKPGLYDLKTGWKITEALAAAGGLAKGIEPNDCTATITRAATGKRETSKLCDVLAGTPGANVLVESGDVVLIEAQETLPVYVVGKVRNPGLYRLRKDALHSMAAVTLAGGALDDAAMDRVTITHLSGSVSTVDLSAAVQGGKQGSDVALQSGDLITVPEETARIAVLGAVREPGFFPLKNGQKLTLADAIGLAKGADGKQGKMGSVAIVRTEGGKTVRKVYDVSRFLASGDVKNNPEIRAGDIVFVPRSNNLDWNSITSTLAAVGIFLSPLH